MTGHPDVSVVLPVYNESDHLLAEIERISAALDDSEFRYELIVVDDGSTDGGSDRLGALDGIRLVQYGRNRGPGFARKAGSAAALGSVVVWTDVDMTYPNERIPELVRLLEGEDQVVGARTSEQGTARFFRVPAKWVIRKVAEFLSGETIPDLNSGMRAFRRDVLNQFLSLMPNGFSHVTTVTMAFLANDYSIAYEDIEYSKRAGRSKFHWFADTQRYLVQVTRMVMLFNPLKLFLPTAVLLLLVGMGKLVYDLVASDFRVAGNTLVLLVAAAAIAIVGLLADLIVQINKPRYEVLPAAFEVTGEVLHGPGDGGRQRSNRSRPA